MRRLHFDGVVSGAWNRGVAHRSHRRRHRGRTAVHPHNADPHQAGKQLEELEDGQYREANVETENTSKVAKHREYLSVITVQNTSELRKTICINNKQPHVQSHIIDKRAVK